MDSGKPSVFRRALLVEDEPQLLQALELALQRMEIPELRSATTLAEARGILAAAFVPDIIFLDRMLPDGEGLELCRELRSSGFRGAIVVLTASGLVEERVIGLDAGADEYLPKPFSWQELAARVRALARRRSTDAESASPSPPVVPSANPVFWTCELDRLRVYGPNGWAELTPLEFRLVEKLIQAEGKIVTREELLKDVWGFKWLPKTRTVDYFMGRLRKSFEPDPGAPRHFLSVRGAGYRFER